ncbi:MAG TPA: sigma 54-interacting transcriptional regulator [Methylomirabilota bacterium]|nr:sigma 54-interacting transcriptional regulator [Methylomirabilota bacterium]
MIELGELLGESPAIAAVRQQAARVLRSAVGSARRRPPILILGETGTGKGLLAAAIHRAGDRAKSPFVDVNCAAIPETLLEAELFGFERGAFTDARQAKVGLFQAAAGGSIFLDEVGLLPTALQSKLLKVIEERTVRRLGSTRSEPVDVSVIAATSEDLAAAVREGRFRADLYHRLAVVTLDLPPLRARGRDVLLLAEGFLARICEDYGLPAVALTPDAQAALLAYSWPGNVRELANVLERAALLADGPVLTADRLGLPSAKPGVSGESAAADAEAESERGVLLEVLRATGWNFTRAAAQLGLPRNTLRYRVERLGLAPEGPAERRRGGRPPTPRRPEPTGPREGPGEAAPEPRRVTLLQVRLAGTAAPGRDPSRALEEAAAKVRSFGGRIEELGPSDLVAIFGVEPDEDAPRRAAYAALAVRTFAARGPDGAPAEAPVKVVLHTVTLPVSGTGSALAVDPEARREAVRMVAPLLALIPAGGVAASAAASRFLARRFELAPLEADGVGSGACRVIQHAEAGRTRFVGRERELRLLRECFDRAAAGHGQVVTIVGEAGIGKSRLVRELQRRLDHDATWVEGHALSFGRAMPFHPVIDMLRRVFRIADTDPESVVGEKMERALGRLGPQLEETRPFLRYLLSLDPGDPAVLAMDPKRRHAAIVRATLLLAERGAELRPHVVVLEDLHWADPATLDWITRLAGASEGRRVLVLVTCRPGSRTVLAGGSHHTALALASLSREESLRVAGSLLGEVEVPPVLERLVIDKAEGNPFFIEELVRSLQELGALEPGGGLAALAARLDHLAVPDTVEEVLLARTDRLDERLRQVLEVGAVIGRVVPFPLLRAVAGHAEQTLIDELRRLQAAEFLRETRGWPQLEHTFKHALTQDVAYGRVAPDRRRALHARIVRAIEELYPDRLGEHVERLAYHAMRGELWPAAVRYARQAGARAFDRSANREAVESFEHALAALARLPESPETLAEAIDVRLAVRSALLQLGELERIARYLREAEVLAAALGDRARLAWVWTYLTITHLFAGQPAEALAVGERALAAAEAVGETGLRASARTPLAHALRERGEYRRAVALFREAIETLTGNLARERLGQAMPPSFYARSMAAFCLADLGEVAEAARLATESAEQTRALDLPFGLALARVALGHTRLVEGRLDEATRALAEALDLIEMRGLPTWFPWAAALQGYTLVRSGRPAEGVALLERAVERAQALPFLFGHSQWVAWLAHGHLLAGRPDEAGRLAHEALRLSRQRGERGYEAWALHVLGEVEAASSAAAAVELHREALALALELGMRPLAAQTQLALTRLGAAAAPLPGERERGG